MKICSLPNHTRIELQKHLKKNIRKYYKGLKNGSLKYDFFVETILSKDPKPNWLKENLSLMHDSEFKNHLITYIQTEIVRYTQLEHKNGYHTSINTSISSENIQNKTPDIIPMTIKERQCFKKMLATQGYSLCIPAKFLTCTESNYLKAYILNGTPIPFEWEKVLNYIQKSTC
ncbi:hypothetical protein [Marinisporobacter balticus]|uniref:Uncharacterized protein n=1 Tax=Marinisporobacter balticus TaxID=2018667 RepID=A0A4R2L5Y5_9FIRM|nr:hypothetical protein [Marinisporobacter balticus]TCO79346.1 hypothetical protein EV214_10264 [Marinisporobacter balticus]